MEWHLQSVHKGVVAYFGGEMFFVDSYDAFDFGKSADVLAAESATNLETIGHTVVSKCTDGKLANRTAIIILQATYSHIIVFYCMTCCLNIFVKDFGVLPWIAPIMEEANKTVTSVFNYGRVCHDFSTFLSSNIHRWGLCSIFSC